MRSSSAAFWWRNSVGASNGMLAQVMLRCAPKLARLKRIPVIGNALRWFGERAVPRQSLVWVRVKEGAGAGLWLAVNPRTGQHVLEGSGERQVQAVLLKHLRPGMVFYDLGANIGFFSLLAARLVGDTGRVVAFEADPELTQRLRQNIKRNAFASVSVEQKAVWSTSGGVLFARADISQTPDLGVGHVTDSPAAGSVSIASVSLDDYTRTAPRPDFIKCDVEGSELEVFRGAHQLLRSKRPAVLCEIHSQENRKAFLEEFAALGYACADCDANHILALPR